MAEGELNNSSTKVSTQVNGKKKITWKEMLQKTQAEQNTPHTLVKRLDPLAIGANDLELTE